MAQVHTRKTTPTGYLKLVRTNKNFRNLWFGQIISLLGDWFNLIASAALIAKLTQSGLAVGGLFVVRMLAPFLVSPIAGVVVDRYDRKSLLVITDIARGITVFGFLLVRSPDQIWLLYSLTAIQLGISGFFFPSRNAILPDVVNQDELGATNALSAATWSTMLALGAALGGIAAGTWGIYPSFIIDGLTFFLSAVFIFQIKVTKTDLVLENSKTLLDGMREYIEGLKYLWQHVDTFAIALIKASLALAVFGGFQVIQVALAERVYPLGENGSLSLGLLFGVVGLGTGLGPIFARTFTGDRDSFLRIAIAAGYLIAAIGLAIVAPLWNFPLVLIGATLRGIGAGIAWVFSTQLLMQLLPGQVRGRVFSTEYALMTLMSAAGSTLGGWGLDAPSVGIQRILWGMVVLTLVMGISWSAWLRFGPNRLQLNMDKIAR